jgi:hypothetical protein
VTWANPLKAFHPFYVFQIASLILWSMDEYYYYAAAIFLISVFSITTTVIETRSVCTFGLSLSKSADHFPDNAPFARNLSLRLRRACST